MVLSVATVAAAFVCGGVPSGVWLARLAGVDVRRAGSGNIGATNVARTAGIRLGVLTLVADVLKGILPVVAAQALDLVPVAVLACGGAAFLGHLFSPFLAFRGGKGVATAVGVFMVLAPRALLVSIGVFAATVAASGYVSLASILAALLLPIACALLHYPSGTVGLAITIAALIVWRHSANIKRLRDGHEPRFRASR